MITLGSRVRHRFSKATGVAVTTVRRDDREHLVVETREGFRVTDDVDHWEADPAGIPDAGPSVAAVLRKHAPTWRRTVNGYGHPSPGSEEWTCSCGAPLASSAADWPEHVAPLLADAARAAALATLDLNDAAQANDVAYAIGRFHRQQGLDYVPLSWRYPWLNTPKETP